jgi:hypothetical protein
MSGKYQLRAEPGARFEQRATYFAWMGPIALVLMAALPAALSLLHATFVASARAPALSSQNAAATAPNSGNQRPKPALANGANAMLGVEGEVLALCSGTPGTKPVARLNCATLSSTIQR